MSIIPGLFIPHLLYQASLVAQLVRNPPVMGETWVWSLGWEDPLEEEMATTPVFLPGESHGQRSLAREQLPTPVFWLREFQRLYSPWGHKESDTTEWLSLHYFNIWRWNFFFICLECPPQAFLITQYPPGLQNPSRPPPLCSPLWFLSWSLAPLKASDPYSVPYIWPLTSHL